MTVLRPQDLDLHNEEGTHVEVPPGAEHRNFRAKMKRHLAAHARDDLPELGMLGQEMADAEQRVKDAQADSDYTRRYAMEVVRKHMDRGVSQAVIARKLRISERALYDFLHYGKRQGGANREDRRSTAAGCGGVAD